MITRHGLFTALSTTLLLVGTLVDARIGAGLAVALIGFGLIAFPQMRRRGILAALAAAGIAAAIVLISRLG